MNQYIIKLLLLSICFTFIYSCDVLDKEKKEEEATGNNIENIGAEIDSLKEKIQQLQEKLKQSQQTAQTPSQPQVNPQTPSQPQVNPQTPAQPQVNPQTPAQPQVNPQTPSQPQVNPQTPSQPQVNPQTPSQPQVNPQTPSQPQVNPQTLTKKEQLKRLITKQQYLQITADSKNSLVCKESNARQLGLPSQPNSEWYYTYENFIDGMALIPKFASEGSEQIRKREIAAFFAHVAQETGTGTLYGAGCFIQELNSWGRQIYTRSTSPGNAAAGYIGRGPHQLSWNYNYKNFSDAIGRPEILQDPDILTREPAVGIAGSLWFWNHTEPGWNGNLNPPFKPSTHDVMVGNWQPTARDIAAGRTKDRYFGVTTNIINGGIECGPGSAGKRQPQNRARYFREYARILGVNLGSVTDEQLTCSTQSNFAARPS